MKKRTMAFGGLLVAVAVTAYSVSGTYAKYISEMGGTDSARVAKWSFNSGAEEFDLFKESYSTKDGVKYVQSLNCSTDENKNLLVDEDGNYIGCDDVVAPGTNGLYSFQLNGEADNIISEVNYKITMKIGGLDKVNKLVEFTHDDLTMNPFPMGSYTTKEENKSYYYSPIKFALVDGTVTDINSIDAAEWGTLDSVITKLSDPMNGSFGFLTAGGKSESEKDGVKTTSIIKGANLEQLMEDSFKSVKTIAWKWDYNDPSAEAIKSDAEAIKVAKLLSKYDTKLGNKAAEGADTTVSLTVEFTFEQTQEAPTVVTP